MRYLHTMTAMLLTSALSSCVVRHYTDELKHQTEQDVPAKTRQWMSEHMSSAHVENIETFYYMNWNYITASAIVEYTLEGDTVTYYAYYDTEKEQFYTDERIVEYDQYLRQMIARDLAVEDTCVDVDTYQCYDMPFTTLNDKDPILGSKELERVEEHMPINALPWKITAKQIEELARKNYAAPRAIHGRHNAYLTLDSFDGVTERFCDFAYLRKHPNTTLYIYSRQELDAKFNPHYELYVERDSMFFVHYTYDQKEEMHINHVTPAVKM